MVNFHSGLLTTRKVYFCTFESDWILSCSLIRSTLKLSNYNTLTLNSFITLTFVVKTWIFPSHFAGGEKNQIKERHPEEQITFFTSELKAKSLEFWRLKMSASYDNKARLEDLIPAQIKVDVTISISRL